jgi:hypothetical protein
LRPVVYDYACPFVVFLLGIVIAGPPAGFWGLNARILRPPQPVVKDYACPFCLFTAKKSGPPAPM